MQLVELRDRRTRLHEPVVVFTEYRRRWRPHCRLAATTSRGMHGLRSLALVPRRSAISRTGASALATDVAGEGLNLHAASRTVVHLELPWTPTTIEQRGPVDRIGQRHTVQVQSFGLGGARRRRAVAVDPACRAIAACGESECPTGCGRCGYPGVVPPVFDEITPPARSAVFVPPDVIHCVQHPRNGASPAVGAVGTWHAGTIRPASDSSAPPPREPWPHSVVIAYIALPRGRRQVAWQRKSWCLFASSSHPRCCLERPSGVVARRLPGGRSAASPA
jgi:hypothetical protein